MTKQEQTLRKMGLTDAEIKQVLADDKRIDKGENLFPLTAEQEKASRQARQADRTPTVYKLDNTDGKRSKKEDADKATLMNALFTAILPICDSYEVANAEREFSFMYHNRKFKVVLSAPRS